MSTFTEIRIGRVPITEEGVDRYRISDSSEFHFTELARCDELNVSVGRIWTEMKVPVPWVEIATANYILGTITFNNPPGSSLTVRGWVDSVEPLSDSVDVPTCRVRWHFDFWEMYKAVASYDYGQVKRRPFVDIATTPVQEYPYVFKRVSAQEEIFNHLHIIGSDALMDRILWVIVARSYMDNGKSVFEYYAIPTVPSNTNSFIIVIPGSPDITYLVPKFHEILGGKFDEYYGFAPEEIVGIWITSVNPTSAVQNDVINSPFNGLRNASYSLYIYGSYASFKIWDRFANPSGNIGTVTFGTNKMSTEDEQIALMDTDGSIVGTLPYGVEVSGFSYYFNISPTNVSLQVVFNRAGSSVTPPLYSRPEGLVYDIPLHEMDLNENAWSSYVFSGQREYDRRTRSVETNSSSAISTASGAGQGAMMGAFGPQGLALGIAGGMVGGLTQYGVETFYRNDELQKSEDRLHSHQPPGMLFSGDGRNCAYRGLIYELVTISFDSYSSTQLSNTRSNYGISVDEILASCDTLVRTTSPTGFYQIPNLIISGALPKEAKDTIKNKFASGVRLI